MNVEIIMGPNRYYEAIVRNADEPEQNEYVYEEVAPNFFHAVCGDHVQFFAYSPDNERGFGGAEFKLNMRDGSVRTIKGPWSSRSSVANMFVEHDKRSTEITLISKEGYRMSAHMRVDTLRPYLHEQGFVLVPNTKWGEIGYDILPK